MALEADLSCPVCTDLFSDPVLLSCGHSFCRQCINDHWTSSSSRNCPVCRQLSMQQPLSNLSLRNTCESYMREKSTKKEKHGEHVCQIHGELIELFCQTDEEALCATCKKQEHKRHKTQPLQQAVRQRKGNLKAAVRPAEKILLSLNAAAQDAKICNYNQSQAQQTERRIQEEFEKLHQFLRKEEESRIAALNEEEKERRGKMKRKMRSLSDRLQEVEERMKDDDVTFLQNYNSIMSSAKCTLLDPELSSEALDVPKHLGNLKYHVWEKMKDICSYYPVILNPNTASSDISVSDDLTSVTSCLRWQNEPNSVPLHSTRVVLGSVGHSIGTHTWEIEVGNSRHWSLGVCFGLEGKPTTQPLTPANGFWGLRRDGDSYKRMTTGMSRLNTSVNPEVVRVKLEDYVEDTFEKKRWRKVSFFDARSDSLITGFTEVPLEKKLFPFVIPEDQTAPLRVVPANIILTVEQKLSFRERHEVLIKVCFVFIIVIFMILLWKTDQQRN